MLIKLKVNSTQNWQKTHEAQKESSLSKQQVEIGDFYKPVMTTHESCMKYNLVALLKNYMYLIMDLNIIRTAGIIVPSSCLLLIPSLQNQHGKRKN